MLNSEDEERELMRRRMRIALAAVRPKNKVARECGISDQAVNGWESTGRVDKRFLPALSRLSGYDLEWLIEGNPDHPVRRDEPNVEPANAQQERRVPVISWVHAGASCEAFDPYPPGHAEDWATPTFKPGPHVYGLRVVGVSMTPRFQPGQILIVDPECHWSSGAFVILKNGDEEVVFRRIVKEAGEWMMVPLNEDYKPKPLGDYRVIGVVREAIDRVA